MRRLTSSIVGIVVIICVISSVLSGENGENAIFEGFDDLVEKAMAHWEVPGVAIAVVKDGKVVHLKGYGYRNVEKGLAVNPQTLFRIGSATKSFTSMAVGLLVDEGILEWDKPVHEYMADFKLYDDYATRHATPKDLLCHRVGLGEHYGMFFLSSLNRDEIYRRLRYLQPVSGFRERYVYCNIMYMTLGVLVERVSGISWEDFLQKRIFKPLGMASSSPLSDGLQARDNAALPYDPRNTELLNRIFHGNTKSGAPAGAIVSNAEDMSKWLLLHLNRGKVGEGQFISEKNLSQMHGPQMGYGLPSYAYRWGKDKYDYAYGFGWEMGVYRGHSTVKHSGAVPGYTARVQFLPSDNIGVVVLTNYVRGYNVIDVAIQNAFDRLLGLEEIDWYGRFVNLEEARLDQREKAKEEQKQPQKKISIEPPTLPLSKYIGTFEHPAYGRYIITLKGNVLNAKFNHIDIGELKHSNLNSFTVSLRLVPPLTFIIGDNDIVEGIYSPWAPGVDSLIFKRIE